MPVKWTAPEVLFGDIAKLSSKSDVYVLLYFKLQNCLIDSNFPRQLAIHGSDLSVLLSFVQFLN